MMELVAASRRTEIEFEASFPQSLLTVALLLRATGRFEGLSEWVVQTAAGLPRALAADLRILGLVTTSCPGLWRDFVRAGRGLGPDDFDELVGALDRLPDDRLRDAARRGLGQRLAEWELASAGAAFEADERQLIDLLERVRVERRQRGEGAEDETAADSALLARLVSQPGPLKRHLVATMQGLWAIYGERCRPDWRTIGRAVDYHRRRRYPDEFHAAFAAITGRTVPDRMAAWLGEVRRVVMTPVSHIGPYLLVTRYDDEIWVAFSAGTAATAVAPQENLAALYPPLKALADETRLQIVSLLAGGERYVGEIAALLDLSQSSASRHLNLLTAAEVLSVRRENNLKYFRINRERARLFVADLEHLLRR
jgi:DNA-binding transcriptional ArsR family regulator